MTPRQLFERGDFAEGFGAEAVIFEHSHKLILLRKQLLLPVLLLFHLQLHNFPQQVFLFLFVFVGFTFLIR